MHYNRRDGVWNGAGHQSRAPFEKIMHWGETQTHIRLHRVSRNDPRISTIFYHYVSRQDAVKHAQIWLKWEMNWTKERWHFCYWKGFFWDGLLVMVVLVGASVLRPHCDVCAHKSLCQDCFCGPSNMRSYWLRELIPAGELVYWAFCVPDGTSYVLRLTSMPGEAYVQNSSVSRVGKAI